MMSNKTSTEVLIVGSGPVGLWLALELRRAEINVLVIDQRLSESDRDSFSKALNLNAGSLATFDSRGLASIFLDHGSSMNRTHFGALETLLDLNRDVLGVRHSHNLRIPQAVTERLLLEKCHNAGVKFQWGLKFLRLSQHGNTVAVTAKKLAIKQNTHNDYVESIVDIQSSWLIGCDGSHSSVRDAANISFEGIPSSLVGVVADAQFSSLPDTCDWLVYRGPKGSAFVTVIGDEKHHRFVSFFRDELLKHSEEVTEAEVKNYLSDFFGSDLGMHSPLWISRFGSACRIATTFRSGRVFLAGDAAHQLFAAGGQGMNIGIQDATNLAWKLAMVSKMESISSSDKVKDKGLSPKTSRILDSYSLERVAATEDVRKNILQQMALLVAKEPCDEALRTAFVEFLGLPKLNSLLAQRVCGFGEPTSPYQMKGQDHPMIGKRLTHLSFGDDDLGLSCVLEMESFTLILLDEDDEEHRIALKEYISTFNNRIVLLQQSAHGIGESWANVSAVLVRPDERIAWVGSATGDVQEMCDSMGKVLRWWLE